MFTRQSRKSRLLFALADSVLITTAFWCAYFLRQNLELDHIFFLNRSVSVLLILAATTAWILAGLWFGVYDRLTAALPREILRRTIKQALTAAIALILFEYLTRLNLSRLFLGLFIGFASTGNLLFRWCARWLGPRLRRFAPLTHVLIVGTGHSAQRIARLIEANESFGLRLFGFADESAGELHFRRSYPVSPIASLGQVLSDHVIDEVIFAVDSQRLAGLEDILLLCEEEGVRTRISVDYFPHVHSDVYLDRLGPAHLLTFSGAPHDEVRLIFKRAADLILASAALIVAAPAMLLISLAIRLGSPGPAIFGQVRCGLNGRKFTLYKFRTMTAGAEARQAELAHLNVKTTAFKIPNDPRVTSFGRWLRKFSIDEWPQLWNILRGEMSIVGPRPAVPNEVERYERWQRRRLRMRPGLTCLWTLAGRDELQFDDWMRLDLVYIDNWSLALDWRIMLRSVPYVLTGRGAS